MSVSEIVRALGDAADGSLRARIAKTVETADWASHKAREVEHRLAEMNDRLRFVAGALSQCQTEHARIMGRLDELSRLIPAPAPARKRRRA